jgi:hypothetical protein
MTPTFPSQPAPLGPLLDATVHTLATGNYDSVSGTALIQTWLHELSHYDGLDPVRLALKNVQDALSGTPDTTRLQVLLAELAEYLRFFTQKSEVTTPDPALPNKLRQLAETLQRPLDRAAEMGHP